MKAFFSKTQIQIALGAVLAATIFSFSHTASADVSRASVHVDEAKADRIRVLGDSVKAVKTEINILRSYFQKNLLPALDKGGADWKPIDSMALHELNQEIMDYTYILKAGDSSQATELQDQMVEVLAETEAFKNLNEGSLTNIVHALTARKGAVAAADRKLYLNKMRYQYGLSGSKHLKLLLEEIFQARSMMSQANAKLAKLNAALAQLK